MSKHAFALLIFCSLSFIPCFSGQNIAQASVLISEVRHLHTPHFKVETHSATYYIEKQSGGCSSMVDSEGRDWIAFKLTGTDGPTLSSDSDYRGIPNLVFQDPGMALGTQGFLAVKPSRQTGMNWKSGLLTGYGSFVGFSMTIMQRFLLKRPTNPGTTGFCTKDLWLAILPPISNSGATMWMG